MKSSPSSPISRSLPPSPLRKSLSVPPYTVSAPPSAYTVSLPASALMLSADSVPNSRSAPAVGPVGVWSGSSESPPPSGSSLSGSSPSGPSLLSEPSLSSGSPDPSPELSPDSSPLLSPLPLSGVSSSGSASPGSSLSLPSVKVTAFPTGDGAVLRRIVSPQRDDRANRVGAGEVQVAATCQQGKVRGCLSLSR